jgi:hypothetical protein
MCTDGMPAFLYLAKWSCAVEAASPPDFAVARTAAWAKATMDNWALGSLADDVGLIVAEFSSNAWTHGSPPVVVTLLLPEGVPPSEVSDAGAGLAVFAGPRPLGAGGCSLPATVDIAQQIGIDGGARGTRVWARLYFRWVPAETEPGAVARLSGIVPSQAGSQCGNVARATSGTTTWARRFPGDQHHPRKDAGSVAGRSA